MCCVPTINVTGVTVNTTTNVATLALDAPLPDRGAFRLRFCTALGHSSIRFASRHARIHRQRSSSRIRLRAELRQRTARFTTARAAAGLSPVSCISLGRKTGCPLLWHP
mgnify:CR=1 FL=1